MRRSRGSRRYTRRIKTIKYSNETSGASINWEIPAGEAQGINMAMITPANIQGVRKCKNFELSLSGSEWGGEGALGGVPILWALVYVPQGTTPSALNLAAQGAVASIYEPSQNVIISGIWPDNLQANYKVKTRLARNLNSGDAIYLVMRTAVNQPQGVGKSFIVTLNYAIAY